MLIPIMVLKTNEIKKVTVALQKVFAMMRKPCFIINPHLLKAEIAEQKSCIQLQIETCVRCGEL